MNKILRSGIVLISLTMFINFLVTAGIGIFKSIHAYIDLYEKGVKGRPGLEIVESLDLFLVALVFLIISLSCMKLFHPEGTYFSKINLPWLKVEDFYQLKHLTWSAFLLTLLITFGTQVLRAEGKLEWTLLIIPTAVLFFSASAKFLKH